ncbi:MAG: transketolase family protein [Candidatus Caenarcaniphilales bacterium]|nr:transketolase family protein [Candidatus Caenarcaniphilales bacterium]
MSEKKATRVAYGEALVELGSKNSDIVVLDADLSGSTNTKKFAQKFPERFFNMGIAEQNMVSTAAGLALTGKIPFASSFAMFATGRAWEQVRNSVAHNDLNVKIAATHAGITLGEDGASHQIIEDIAIMNVIPKMSVLVPADAVEAKAMTKALVEYQGPAYIRLGRPNVPIIFDENDFEYELGKARLVKEGQDITIIAYGVMLSKAIEAAEKLETEGVKAEVINVSTIKPLDESTILQSAKKTGSIVVAEEHNRVGGVNCLIASCISNNLNSFCPMEVVAIEDRFGQSGKVDDLLEEYGLTSENIVEKAKKCIKRKVS